jgi:hypothetical protein
VCALCAVIVLNIFLIFCGNHRTHESEQHVCVRKCLESHQSITYFNVNHKSLNGHQGPTTSWSHGFLMSISKLRWASLSRFFFLLLDDAAKPKLRFIYISNSFAICDEIKNMQHDAILSMHKGIMSCSRRKKLIFHIEINKHLHRRRRL